MAGLIKDTEQEMTKEQVLGIDLNDEDDENEEYLKGMQG